MRLFRRRRRRGVPRGRVTFCESCGQVCDAASRAAAARQHAQWLRYRAGPL